jgi:hypothetical protein
MRGHWLAIGMHALHRVAGGLQPACTAVGVLGGCVEWPGWWCISRLNLCTSRSRVLLSTHMHSCKGSVHGLAVKVDFCAGHGPGEPSRRGQWPRRLACLHTPRTWQHSCASPLGRWKPSGWKAAPAVHSSPRPPAHTLAACKAASKMAGVVRGGAMLAAPAHAQLLSSCWHPWGLVARDERRAHARLKRAILLRAKEGAGQGRQHTRTAAQSSAVWPQGRTPLLPAVEHGSRITATQAWLRHKAAPARNTAAAGAAACMSSRAVRGTRRRVSRCRDTGRQRWHAAGQRLRCIQYSV